MEELSIQYFRELLDNNINELKAYCKEWEDISEDKDIPEDVMDEIRTTIGLTNLLMRQKLKQFGELIDDSEHKRGEKEITCIDLQGFWDMVFHEVEKIQKSFKKLQKCQNNNWVFVEEPLPKVVPKKVGLKNKPTLSSVTKTVTATKAHAAAARQRLAEAKQKMREANKKTQETNGNGEVAIIVTKDSSASKTQEDRAADIDVQQKIDSKPEKEVPEISKDIQSMEDEETSSKKTSKRVAASKSNKKNTLPQEVDKQRKRQKSEKSESKGKENLAEVVNKKELLSVPIEKVASQRKKRGKSKDLPPLQCVTRSARRAMLLQQNELK